MSNNLDDIKNNLTLNQIFSFLSAFDAQPVLYEEYIISRTICHGGDSHKLYYYDNTKLFKCYTECPEESFDIFQLVIKLHQLQGNEKYSLSQAYYEIINFFGISVENKNFQKNEDILEDWKFLNNYNENLNNLNNKKVEYRHFDNKILTFLPHPRILLWEKEGMTKEILASRNICYNPSSQAIVIPHYDKDNNLIGIRERTLIKENEVYGKYRPMYINHTMYNHALGYNLYNLNYSKENIKTIKKAIIFERRKKLLIICLLFWYRK